ncbi:zinc-binding protein A33-like [Rhinoderma darwinii]|uniref:zinc-binding protein A33-like n=1 Tax=Rhinoderma darwinii TaxID=43563 RepID=UPI003F66BB06
MNPPAFEELKCCLCKELYKSPVMLGCGHSFCKICLDEKLQAQLERKCPSCQERLKPNENPTPNILLANLISCLVRQRKELCESHGEKLLFFCMNCETAGCMVCKDSAKHLRHTFLPLQEADEIFKNKLNYAICTLEKRFQSLKCEIGSQEEEVKKFTMTQVQMERHLKSEFLSLHLYLDSIEYEMRERLRQESEASTQAMTRNMFVLETKRERMENSILRMQKKRDTSDIRDFLADIKDFLQEFSTEQEEEMKTEIRVEAPTLNAGLYCGPIQYMAWENMKKVLQPGISNIVLDPATAHPALCISDDLTMISYKPSKVKENIDTPKRYNTMIGVLGSRGFRSGKHYWLVDVGMKEEWILGMAKDSCNRKGEFDVTPEQGYWTIKRSKDGVYSALSSRPIELPVQDRAKRIGVYVEYEAGQVSFYNTSGPAHMYTFTSNFTEGLYPFLSPCENERQIMRIFHLKV